MAPTEGLCRGSSDAGALCKLCRHFVRNSGIGAYTIDSTGSRKAIVRPSTFTVDLRGHGLGLRDRPVMFRFNT